MTDIVAAELARIDWVAVLVRVAKSRPGPKPHPRTHIVNGMAAHLPAMFAHFDITTPRRQAHFVSQVALECDYFQTLEEYASGAAYEGRKDLGNTQPGDGRRFKGRAPLQVTGRANYAQAQRDLSALGFTCDLLNHPEQLAEDVRLATWACGVWWHRNKTNAVADADADGEKVSRAVNLGNPKARKPANHEADRKALFAAATEILANPPLVKVAATKTPAAANAPAPVMPSPPPEPGPPKVVNNALPDFVIEAAQRKLRELGYFEVGKPDGSAGDRTVGAVSAYQSAKGLPVTGVLDPDTIRVLGEDKTPRAVAPERANATLDDLRAGGSRTVTKIDEAKSKLGKANVAQAWQAVVGVVLGGVGAVKSLFSDTWESLGVMREVITDIPLWAWGALAVVISYVTYRHNSQAARAGEEAQLARLDDERTGKNAGVMIPPNPAEPGETAGDLASDGEV
jgi:putative chitinase